MLRYFARTWHPFDRSRDVVIFLLGSSLAAAVVGGAIGTLSLWAGGFVPAGEVRITFMTFFLSDAAGIAVFGALVLAWYRGAQADRNDCRHFSSGPCDRLADRGAGDLEPLSDRLSFICRCCCGRPSAAGPRGVTLAAAAITAVAILATIDGGRLFRRQDRQRIDPAARSASWPSSPSPAC